MSLIAKAEGFVTNAGTTDYWRFFQVGNQFTAERDDDCKSLTFTSRTELDKSVRWFETQGFTITRIR